jgi:leader peptidase (prepilin peptidase) / N-methyltransferase
VADLPPSAAWIVAVFGALLGAVVGSFLNVVIARVPAGQSVVRPRSRCPRCHAPIAWYDNVPIVSWIALRARCRRCRAPISARYPLVEGAVAGAALFALARHGVGAAALAELVLVALLLALAAIDLDTWLLPYALTLPLIALGLGASALGLTLAGGFASAAAGAAVGFGVFAAIALVGERLLKKEALGWGDVWLLAGIGAWLGLPALLPVVLLASLQGSVVGLVLLRLGRGEPGPEEGGAATADGWIPPRHAVPFGPFLAAGAVEWLYLAEPISRVFPALDAFR